MDAAAWNSLPWLMGGVGLAFLAVFAPVGQFLGANLGINLFNALILGALGVPGFGLLMMLNWVLQ